MAARIPDDGKPVVVRLATRATGDGELEGGLSEIARGSEFVSGVSAIRRAAERRTARVLNVLAVGIGGQYTGPLSMGGRDSEPSR